ncbi:MAG: ACP S-malonyltransferase [Lachnospiraceae bacterium]
MSKIAFIFPGQGAQKAGMGKDFYTNSETARQMFDKASELLNIDMKALCFEENDKLNITEYTQAAMVTTSLAMTEVVKEKGLKPDVTAGLSLGEYCAVVTAGGMQFEDAVFVTRKRGLLMQNAVPAGVGGMSAVVGLTAGEIEKVTSVIDGVSIANYNCPGQIVITGMAEAVTEAGEQLKAAGARRVIPLKVSGPFHSPLLKGAGKELMDVLDDVKIGLLDIPYVANVTGEYIMNSNQTKELLAAQVASSVRWQQSVEAMIADGVDQFVEIGPGKTLAAFIKKINRDVTVYNIETWDDVDKVIGEVLC